MLSGAAIGVALVIALPLGVALGHLHRGSFLAINVGNVGRALPSLAVIAIGLAFLGIGFTNVMVALVILAVPPMLTNAYVAVDQVDPDAVEAARGDGHVAPPGRCGGSSCRSLSRSSSRASARRRSTSSRRPRSPPIAGGGGLGEIIVDQASYRLRGRRSAPRSASRLLAFAVDAALRGPPAAGHPARLRGAVPAFEAGPRARAGRGPRPSTAG